MNSRRDLAGLKGYFSTGDSHAFTWRLIRLVDRRRSQAAVDLIVRLYDLAALTPEGSATITHTASRYVESSAYVPPLNHAENPTTPKQREEAVDNAVAVEIFGRWVVRVLKS